MIAANRAGQLTLEAETDEVTIATYFKHMEVDVSARQSQDGRPESIKKDDRFEARIDNQKLYSFLHSQQLNAKKIVCNIVDGQSVYLMLHADETVIHYCLPAMLSL